MPGNGVEQVGSHNKVAVVTKSNCRCCSGDLPNEIENCRKEQIVDPQKVQHIAAHIRREDGIEFKDKKLKHCLADGLSSKAEGIISQEDEVLDLLNLGAKSDLDAAKRIAQRKSDENLSSEDKKYVADKLNKSLEITKGITENPLFMSSLGCAGSSLCSWVSGFADFIMNLFCNCNDEDKQEEERKKCEERQEAKKDLDAKCRLMRRSVKRRKNFYLDMESIRSRIFALTRSLSAKKGNDALVKNQLDSFLQKQDYVKGKYRDEFIKEDYYSRKEEEIRDSMLPSYVCDPAGINLNLDLLC